MFSRGMTGTHAPLLPPVIALAAAFVGHQFDAGNQAPLPHVTNVLEISQRSQSLLQTPDLFRQLCQHPFIAKNIK